MGGLRGWSLERWVGVDFTKNFERMAKTISTVRIRIRMGPSNIMFPQAKERTYLTAAMERDLPGDSLVEITGNLVEIALVSEPEAACPGARVLRTWEA